MAAGGFFFVPRKKPALYCSPVARFDPTRRGAALRGLPGTGINIAKGMMISSDDAQRQIDG